MNTILYYRGCIPCRVHSSDVESLMQGLPACNRFVEFDIEVDSPGGIMEMVSHLPTYPYYTQEQTSCLLSRPSGFPLLRPRYYSLPLLSNPAPPALKLTPVPSTALSTSTVEAA